MAEKENETNDVGDGLPGYWPHARYDAQGRRPPPRHVPKRGASEAKASASLDEAREETKARARDLRSLLGTYLGRHWPRPTPAEAPPSEPPRVVGAYARWLPLLQAVPWALGVVFLFSFVWDFPGVAVGAFGYALPLDGLLRVLSVSGLIGFFTNWLAITMLFHPRQARPLFGQGLIPAQRERVIFRLAKAVSEDLINEEIIKEKIEASGLIAAYRARVFDTTRGVLEDPAFRRELKTLTADYAQNVLMRPEVQRRIVAFTIERLERQAEQQGLSRLALKAYRFFGEDDFRRRIDEAVRQLPESVDGALDGLDHLLDRVPPLLEKRSEEIERLATRAVLRAVENLDVYEMVHQNMRNYDDRRLEELLKKTSNEQLNYIKYLGAVLGLVGGFVIWNAPLALGTFAALSLVLYAVDEALLRRRRA